MTEEHIKERLSLAYINAVSAAAGFTCNIMSVDYGIDGCINDIQPCKNRKGYTNTGFTIDFQAKSTVTAYLEDDKYVYDLKVENYLDLIDTEVGNPRILILYILPRDDKEWLNITHNVTTLKKCAYWCSLRGEPNTNNTGKVRIKIPINQLLTADTLREMMKKVKEGKCL